MLVLPSVKKKISNVSLTVGQQVWEKGVGGKVTGTTEMHPGGPFSNLSVERHHNSTSPRFHCNPTTWECLG